MLHIGHSSFMPDYYAEFVSDTRWTWFIFPWNVYEDISNLSSKIEMNHSSLDDVRKKLKESFDLEVEEGILEKVLIQMVRMKKVTVKGDLYSLNHE